MGGAMALPTPYRTVESIKAKPRKQRLSAMWTMLGTWLLLTAYAVINDGYADYWRALATFLNGSASIDQLHSGDMVRMIPTVAAMVSVDILITIPVAILVQRVVATNPGDHKVSSLFHTDKPKEQYGAIMTTLTGEELFARWIFLGVIGQLPVIRDYSVAFYALFIVGNAVWALVHLNNLKNKQELQLSWYQKVVFVLPQFIGGVLITAIYLPYGLLGAFIAHVVFDMVLFANDRVDVFDLGEKLICAYHFVVGTAGLLYFVLVSQLDIRDMKHWLDNSITSFALPGWTFWDYTAAIVMLTSYATLVMELLLYDREGGETKREALKDWWHVGVFMLAAYTIVKGTQGITYLPMAGVVICLSLLGAFFVKSSSGSGVARIFWEGMLIGSVVICGLLAMDERHGLLLMCILMTLWLPDRVIRYFDKDELPVDNAEEHTCKETTRA